jgi:hypothetical protein
MSTGITQFFIGVQVKCGGCGRTEMTLAELLIPHEAWYGTGKKPEVTVAIETESHGHVSRPDIMVIKRPEGWIDEKKFAGVEWRCGKEGCFG